MIEDILGVDLGGSKMHFIIYHDGKLIEERYPTGVDCTSEPIRDHLYDFHDRLGFKPRAIGMAIPGGVNAEGTFITLTDSLPMTCYTPASYLRGTESPSGCWGICTRRFWQRRSRILTTSM